MYLPLLLLFAVQTSAGSAKEKAAPAVVAGGSNAFFVFGDSTVDVGTNNYIETIPRNRADYPPYGRNGFFDAPTGRFSDGRVIVDFIAEFAKLPIIPPFLQPSAKFNNGANFASGGAGIIPETNTGLAIDLQTQLKHFEEAKSSLVKEMGATDVRKLIQEAVYFISIGSNDYIFGYLLNPTMREAFAPDEYIGMVIGNLTASIQALYEKGARKFCFLGLSPLGCLPTLRAANPKADGSCYDDISQLAVEHNKALSAVLVSLEHLLKGFKYVNTDFYNWLNGRIHNPTKYGFNDGVNACCGTGPYGGVFSCGGNKEVSEYKVCENPEEYVWWDSIHASETIHRQLAMVFWSETAPSVGPYNLEKLFLGGAEKLMVEDVVHEQDDISYYFSKA